MNKFEKRQLFLTSFLAALYLKPNVRDQFARQWLVEPEEIDALEIKSVPSLIFNMVVSNEIRKQIGAADGIKEFFFSGNLYLLDVPPHLSDAGFILPVFDAPPLGAQRAKNFRGRNIKCLEIYRHAKDSKPFILGNYRENFNVNHTDSQNSYRTITAR